MSVQSEVVGMYELMLSKGASEGTARVVAMALYRELVPDCDYCRAREVVTRVVDTAKSDRPEARRAPPLGARSKRLESPAPRGDDHSSELSDFSTKHRSALQAG